MTVFWLSLLLAAAGCSGLLLAGRGRWYGWLIGLAIQPVWVVFAIVTEAYGLILTACMYGAVYAKNLVKWRVTQRAAQAEQDAAQHAREMRRDGLNQARAWGTAP